MRANVLSLGFLALIVVAQPARADLIDLGNGMIYDTVQDLTWLQDVRYARTSGFDADGLLSQFEAIAWAENLVYGGFDDWRLPQSFVPSALPLERYHEMSEVSMLFQQLGWRIESYIEYDGSTTGNNGPFLNERPWLVWFGNRHAEAWHGSFVWDVVDGGANSPWGAWAVRDGGSPEARVPEPSTLPLLAIAAIGWLATRRRPCA